MHLVDSRYHPESTVDIRAPSWGCPSCRLCNGTCPPLQCHKEQSHRPRIPLCPPARESSVSPPGVSCCGATQFLHRHRSLESGKLTFGEARRLPTDPTTRDVVTLWKGLPRSLLTSEAGVLPALIHACSEGLRGTPLVPGPCPGQGTWCRRRHTLADGRPAWLGHRHRSPDLQEAASSPSLGLRECLGPAGPSTPVVRPHDSEVPYVAGGQCLQLSSFLFRMSVMTQIVGSQPHVECEYAT